MRATQLLIYPRHPLRKRIAIERAQPFRIALVPEKPDYVSAFHFCKEWKRNSPDVPQALGLESRPEPYLAYEAPV